jgi:O-antigen biosynthesis protein WbqP
MKRLFDLLFAIILSLVLIAPMVLIGTAVFISSKGPVIHWSKRIGKNNKVFKMPKFRSMRVNAPNVATHLLEDPKVFFSPIGSFLRKSSLDELPQLFSILIGDMSFVGPRPALFNQEDLINLRMNKGLHVLKPGITGLAQINGRDKISIEQKVFFDNEYLLNQSFYFDMKIIWTSVLKVIKHDNVSH